MIVVLTGASRGMGRALAVQSLQPGTHLLTLARRPDPALADLVPDGGRLTQWAVDLADAPAAAARLADWLDGQQPDDATLINNAATLSGPGPLREGDPAELALAVRVGLEAPLLLTAAFLRATADWSTDRRVLNISSGLGRRPMAGSADYCAVKAGLDNFSASVALEEAGRPHGARIVALAPGVIDTDMQVQLRGADRSRFPEGDRFEQLRTTGRLDSPEQAAAKVLAYLARPDFGSTPVADVRDA
ncbi:MAG TPA: SDR family NAD(P)-dependent oxidoreductase [Propionicimonas sp.]|jgi:NAD(P)-dependent dehydrogenase (short-subunit alcohol dehydrogenase family)|nr:SDR family NAD(P)-dependent oxidoreductase [Propionicimonas sp.]